MKKLLDYKDNKPKEVKLKDDQELNSTPLNDMKNALGGLKIVNVTHKPERLSADLKAARDFVNQEAFEDLVRRGFPLLPVGERQVEIGSNDGEVTVGLKDGVEYVLRFGNEVISRNSSSDNKDGEEKKADAADAKDQTADADKPDADGGAKNGKPGSSTNRQRYIMVMAQFNPDLIPKPTLEPVPEGKSTADKPADASAVGAAKGDSAKAESKSGESKNGAAKERQIRRQRRDRFEENRRRQNR